MSIDKYNIGDIITFLGFMGKLYIYFVQAGREQQYR